MSRRPFLAILVLLFGLALGGCKQGKGDRCQLDSDCSCTADDGRKDVCVIVTGLEGLCCEGQTSGVDAAVVDAGVVDSAASDASALDAQTD